jgi:hypothetical protein
MVLESNVMVCVFFGVCDRHDVATEHCHLCVCVCVCVCLCVCVCV